MQLDRAKTTKYSEVRGGPTSWRIGLDVSLEDRNSAEANP